MMNSGQKHKRASLFTLGCRLNQSESASLAAQLAVAGYEVVPFGEPADLGIVHTCTVTREADAKSRKLVRQFIRANPDAYTAVIGCYAQMDADALSEIEGVDLIVGNQEKHNLLAYVAEGKNAAPLVIRDRMTRDDFTMDLPPPGEALSQRANLKIQDGCDFMCSFCIIPFARGRARSRTLPNLLGEAHQLVARGAKELVLTGVNVGTYDSGEHGLVHVVDALNGIPGLARIRISSIEPATVPEALFARMADPAHRLVPYLHLPMQSGSNRILTAMRRRYTREEWLDFANRARACVPDIGIGTDILVGFPGETDADFEQSLDCFTASPAFYAHVFKYSERPGTASVRIRDKVDPDTLNRRSARLRRRSAEKQRAWYAAHAGRTLPVLFEMEENGHWTGYTENYIRVAARAEDNLRNTLRPVALHRCQGDVLFGELLAKVTK